MYTERQSRICIVVGREKMKKGILIGNGSIIHSTTSYAMDGTAISGIQIGYADYMTIKTIRRFW